MDDFTRFGNTIFWTNEAFCPPELAAMAPEVIGTETLHCVARTGSTRETLYARRVNVPPPGSCTADTTLLSNIVADDRYVYWVNADGLVRLDRNNIATAAAPSLLNGQFPTASAGELALSGEYLWAILQPGAVQRVWRIHKSTGAHVEIAVYSEPNGTAHDIQAAGSNA